MNSLQPAIHENKNGDNGDQKNNDMPSGLIWDTMLTEEQVMARKGQKCPTICKRQYSNGYKWYIGPMLEVTILGCVCMA